MRKVFFTLPILLLSTLSNAYDQYLGYWQLKNTPEILKIYKNNKNTYLINIDIAKRVNRTGFVGESIFWETIPMTKLKYTPEIRG